MAFAFSWKLECVCSVVRVMTEFYKQRTNESINCLSHVGWLADDIKLFNIPPLWSSQHVFRLNLLRKILGNLLQEFLDRYHGLHLWIFKRTWNKRRIHKRKICHFLSSVISEKDAQFGHEIETCFKLFLLLTLSTWSSMYHQNRFFFIDVVHSIRLLEFQFEFLFSSLSLIFMDYLNDVDSPDQS